MAVIHADFPIEPDLALVRATQELRLVTSLSLREIERWASSASPIPCRCRVAAITTFSTSAHGLRYVTFGTITTMHEPDRRAGSDQAGEHDVDVAMPLHLLEDRAAFSKRGEVDADLGGPGRKIRRYRQDRRDIIALRQPKRNP